MPKLSVIIPVLNEEETLAQVVSTVLTVPLPDFEKEILIVDDGSTDGTDNVLQGLKADIHFIHLKHEQNLGKGAAIITGLKNCTGDFVLVQDADLEYDPADYVPLLQAFDERTQVVYGRRVYREQWQGYWHYVLGNRLLTAVCDILFFKRLHDIYTCYKVFRASAIKDIDLVSRGFQIEAEITAKLLRRNIPIKEVPIHYFPRRFGKGKKIRMSDGWKGISALVKYRFSK